jgi:hypothetical protein
MDIVIDAFITNWVRHSKCACIVTRLVGEQSGEQEHAMSSVITWQSPAPQSVFAARVASHMRVRQCSAHFNACVPHAYAHLILRTAS